MSGYNFPSADFLPQLTGYTGQAQFRFWCQKVLPLVYDDSLSYYELLAKVVVYLNNIIKDVSSAEGNIGSLENAFKLLEEYVNNYTLVVNPETVEEILEKHPEWTTTVEDGSIDISKLNEDVKDKFIYDYTKMRGTSASLNRSAIFFDFSVDTVYRNLQATTYDGEYYYFFKASVNGGSTLIEKRDSNFNVVAFKEIPFGHVNDATFTEGLIVFIDNPNTSTVYGISKDLGSAAVVLKEDYGYNNIEYYNGSYISVTTTKIVFANTNFEVVEEQDIKYNNPTTSTANQGICVCGDVVYSARFTPSSIYMFKLNGEEIARYDLGFVNGPFVVGELESVFNVNGVICCATTQYTGKATNDKVQQVFNVNFIDGVVSNMPSVGASYARVYVDGSANNPLAKGTAGAPYPSVNWAIRERSCVYGGKNIVYVTVNTTPKDDIVSIAGVQGLFLRGVSPTNVIVNGFTIQNSSGIMVESIKVMYNDSGAYETDTRYEDIITSHLINIDRSDVVMRNVNVDCANSDACTFWCFSSVVVCTGGTTQNANAARHSWFSGCIADIGRSGDALMDCTDDGCGPYVASGTSKFNYTTAPMAEMKNNNDGQLLDVCFDINLNDNPIVVGVNTYNYRSQLPSWCEGKTPLGLSVTAYGIGSNKPNSFGPAYFTDKYTFEFHSSVSYTGAGVLKVWLKYNRKPE